MFENRAVVYRIKTLPTYCCSHINYINTYLITSHALGQMCHFRIGVITETGVHEMKFKLIFRSSPDIAE